MRTKTAISSLELNRVQVLIDRYHAFRCRECVIVTEIAELLGCTAGEALVVADNHDTVHNVLMDSPIEIYDDEPDIIPMDDNIHAVDRETWIIWSFMAGGFALVMLLLYAVWG